jgi:CRISPR-associated protein Cas2
MFIVVAYDVANDRRRARMRSVLREDGLPVQESVFACELDATDAKRMMREVRATIRKRTDLVRFYTICAACRDLVENDMGPVAVETPPALVV